MRKFRTINVFEALQCANLEQLTSSRRCSAQTITTTHEYNYNLGGRTKVDMLTYHEATSR